MLTTLTVKHFTIVDELLLEFNAGMVAFTGETGAGKSVTLDALSLVLGARADSDVVRAGCQQCDITATFDVVTNPLVNQWLIEQELLLDEHELTLRRVITTKGRSKSFINGVPFPLMKTKELGCLLVNIHGQNQQYHLLKQEVHQAQLDAFSLCEKHLQSMSKQFDAMQVTRKTISSLMDEAQDESREALLRYQVQELDELAVTDGEFDFLSEEYKLLANQREFSEKVGLWQQWLQESDSSVLSILHQLQLDITKLEHPKLKTFAAFVDNAIIQCEEGISELQSFSSRLEEDPNRLQEVEKRMTLLFDTARKHQIKPQELTAFHASLLDKITRLDNAQEELVKLKESLAQFEKEALVIAKKLHQIRLKESRVLASEITKAIRELGMPHAEVEVRISEKEQLSATGYDKVEYWVSLNQGMDKKPLSKIASGGELSRISLAIQVLTAEKKAYPTLIFDEVDTGIGGAQAANVGQLLRRLGNHTQVFCVTHQPQVAANANQHFLVEKKVIKGQTMSSFKELSDKERATELARMLSGVKMTKETLMHAEKLLEQVE